MALIEGLAAGATSLVTRLNPYSAYIKVGLEVVALLGAGVGGWELHKGLVYDPHLTKDAKLALRMQKDVDRINAASVAISSNWAEKLALQKDTFNGNTRTIIQAIPVYLPAVQRPEGSPRPVAAPDSDIPLGAVRLLDLAAAGLPAPAPTPGTNYAGPSGIDLPQAVSITAGNYGTCLSWRAEVLAWRGWYRDNLAAWPKDPKK